MNKNIINLEIDQEISLLNNLLDTIIPLTNCKTNKELTITYNFLKEINPNIEDVFGYNPSMEGIISTIGNKIKEFINWIIKKINNLIQMITGSNKKEEFHFQNINLDDVEKKIKKDIEDMFKDININPEDMFKNIFTNSDSNQQQTPEEKVTKTDLELTEHLKEKWSKLNEQVNTSIALYNSNIFKIDKISNKIYGVCDAKSLYNNLEMIENVTSYFGDIKYIDLVDCCRKISEKIIELPHDHSDSEGDVLIDDFQKEFNLIFTGQTDNTAHFSVLPHYGIYYSMNSKPHWFLSYDKRDVILKEIIKQTNYTSDTAVIDYMSHGGKIIEKEEKVNSIIISTSKEIQIRLSTLRNLYEHYLQWANQNGNKKHIDLINMLFQSVSVSLMNITNILTNIDGNKRYIYIMYKKNIRKLQNYVNDIKKISDIIKKH